jgi:hypothetical protein
MIFVGFNFLVELLQVCIFFFNFFFKFYELIFII